MGYNWTILDYWIFDGETIAAIAETRTRLYATLLAVALPFIWMGVVLTMKRLEDANLPGWLVLFFFLPPLNLALFTALSFIPSRASEDSDYFSANRSTTTLSSLIPKSAVGSAAVGILATVALSTALLLIAVPWLGEYGWGVFVGIPFFLGFNSVMIYGFHSPRGIGPCLLVASLSVVFTGVLIILIALEGFICVFMAAPIAMVLGLFGGCIGFVLQRSRRLTNVFPAIVLFMPGAITVEPLVINEPPLIEVRTSVIVNADRETVWKNVISFPPLPEPSERLFRTGVSYPMRAEIQGNGVGAVRHCVFSTGAFVEPITVWDQPKRLRFNVTSQPPPMQEWSIYSNLRPAHLDAYLLSRQGEFLLTELPDGRTLLEGTTVYQNRMWPTAYWQLWSDYIIHRIHQRVLEHIKNLSEKE